MAGEVGVEFFLDAGGTHETPALAEGAGYCGCRVGLGGLSGLLLVVLFREFLGKTKIEKLLKVYPVFCWV